MAGFDNDTMFAQIGSDVGIFPNTSSSDNSTEFLRAGSDVILTVNNTSDTGASGSRIVARVEGVSAGNVFYRTEIGSAHSWSIGAAATAPTSYRITYSPTANASPVTFNNLPFRCEVAGGTGFVRCISFLSVASGGEQNGTGVLCNVQNIETDANSDAQINIQVSNGVAGGGGGNATLIWTGPADNWAAGVDKSLSNQWRLGTDPTGAFLTANSVIRCLANKEVIFDGLNALTVQRGTTGERPGTPVNGMVRYNSTTAAFEGYQNGSWQNLIGGGGGGAWTFVSTATASDDATIEFNNLTATAYKVVAINIIPATDDTDLWVRVSDDNGVSFETVDYQHTAIDAISATSVPNSQTAAEISLFNLGIGNATGEFGLCGEIQFMSIKATDKPCFVTWQVARQNTSGDLRTNSGCGVSADDAAGGSTDDVDAIQLLMSTGNITSGQFHLYSLVTS